MNRNLPEPGPEVSNCVCVICTSTTNSSLHPSQENGTAVSFSQSTNSLREDDVYPVGILSETFCQFLHLPLNSFKDRFMQENIFFCKSCALKVQRIHIVLIQLNTLQEELDGFKTDIHKQLEIDQTGNLRNVENVIFKSDAATNCNHNSLSAPTVNLRNDIIQEVKLSQISHGRDTVPINISNHDEFIETLSNLNDNNIVENETRVIVTAGTVIDDVFKEEILDDNSNGANENHFVHTEILRFPTPISIVDVTATKRPKRRVSQKRRIKPQSRNSKRQKLSNELSASGIVGESQSQTLILKLTRLEDEMSFKKRIEMEKNDDTQDRNCKDMDDDEDWIPPLKLKLKESTKSKSSKPKSKCKVKPQIKKPNLKYLNCPNEGCFKKFLKSKDKAVSAEKRLEVHMKKIHQGITKPYECSECPKTFKHLTEQICHSRIHTGETPFVCEVEGCGKRYRIKHYLKLHSKIHTSRERTFCCQLCPDKFYDMASLKTHRLTHTKDRPYTCELCPLNYIRKLDLQIHQRFVHSVELGLEQYKCQFCKKVLSRKRYLIAHEKMHTGEDQFGIHTGENEKSIAHEKKHTNEDKIGVHTGETPTPIICGVCGREYKTKLHLKFHSKVHTSRERKFCCQLCPNKFYKNIHLNAHMLTHTKDRPYMCELCPSNYVRKLELENHQRCAHPNELGLEQYKCQFCGKVLSRKRYLIAHEKMHTKEDEFKCSICDYKSHVKQFIIAHERRHVTESIYKCDQCDKAYKEEKNLVIHKRNHTGERPFKCKLCGKCYKVYGHLVNHEQTHSDELKHKCSICGQVFINRNYLLRHEEIHKKEKVKRKRNKGGKEKSAVRMDVLPKIAERMDVLPKIAERMDVLPKIDERMDVLPKIDERMDVLPEIAEQMDVLPKIAERMDVLPKIDERMDVLPKFTSAEVDDSEICFGEVVELEVSTSNQVEEEQTLITINENYFNSRTIGKFVDNNWSK